MSISMSRFTPRQMALPSVQLMEEVQGDVSDQVARHTLTLIPPIAPGSIILDNACGSGTVTEAILASLPSGDNSDNNIRIHATDVAPARIQAVASKASQNNWPAAATVTPSVAPAQALPFPANTFTHSFTNFALFALPDADAPRAAAHIHRTLVPGGVAVVTTWASMPHVRAVAAAHAATRAATALRLHIPQKWFEAATLEHALREAGFAAVRMSSHDAELRIEDVGRWAGDAWSVLGQPAGGWEARDEEEWERAVAVLEERLRALEEVESVGAGARVKMVANIAVAVK